MCWLVSRWLEMDNRMRKKNSWSGIGLADFVLFRWTYTCGRKKKQRAAFLLGFFFSKDRYFMHIRRSHTYVGIFIKKLITWDGFGIGKTFLSITIVCSTRWWWRRLIGCFWWTNRRKMKSDKWMRILIFFTCIDHCLHLNCHNLNSRKTYCCCYY